MTALGWFNSEKEASFDKTQQSTGIFTLFNVHAKIIVTQASKIVQQGYHDQLFLNYSWLSLILCTLKCVELQIEM